MDVTADTLLSELSRLGCVVTVDGGDLLIQADAPLPDDLIAELRRCKPDLLCLVSDPLQYLKHSWLTAWREAKAALERGDHETADAHFEAWAAARAALLAELGTDGYRDFLLDVARQTLGSDAVCDRYRVPVVVSVVEREGNRWRRRECPMCGEAWLKPIDLDLWLPNAGGKAA